MDKPTNSSTLRSEQEQQQGFEPMDYDAKYPFEMKDLEITGFPSDEEKIKQIAIKQGTIVIITEQNRIFRWKQNKENKCKEYFLPETKRKIVQLRDKLMKNVPFMQQKTKDAQPIDRIFMDSKGDHIFLCNNSGKNYYINERMDEIKYVHQVSSIIKSGFFEDQQVHSYHSTDFSKSEEQASLIVGTNDGQIVQITLEIRNNELENVNVKELQRIPDQKTINNLYQLYFKQKNNEMVSLILATTHSSIFYFLASSRLALSPETVFNTHYYDLNTIKDAELPLFKSHISLIDICYTKLERPHSLIFTNGHGLIYTDFPEADEEMNPHKFKTVNHYNYSVKKEENDEEIHLSLNTIPTAIALTQYHYYILDKNALTILSRITQKIVHTEDLRSMGYLIGLIQDTDNECIWVYSDSEIRKIELELEDQGVWRVYLEANKFKKAYETCSVSQEEYTQYMGKIYADHLIKKKKYKKAAKIYLQCSIPFEQAYQKLILESINNRPCQKEGCEYYLNQTLQKISNPAHAAQKQIILTLLLQCKVQLLLNITNEYKAEYQKEQEKKEHSKILSELHREQAIHQENITKFLKDYSEQLNEDATFQILQSHGFTDLIILFCELRGKLEMVIIHNINEEDYDLAMTYLKKLNPQSMKQIVYKYSHVLMRHKPRRMCHILTKKIKTFDPTKILSSLFNIPKEEIMYAAEILEHCMQFARNIQSVHNAYIFFLAELKKEQDISIYLLKSHKEYRKNFRWSFNIDFALSAFTRNKLYSSIIQLYGMIELWSDAVNLALEHEELDQAKNYARRVQNEVLSKKLWMQIVKYMLKNKDKYSVEQIIDLTEDKEDDQGYVYNDCSIKGKKSTLKIDEIIPEFDQNLKIEQFQGKISKSLQEYNQEIKDLKELMEFYSQQADNCQRELVFIKDGFFQTDTQHKCERCNDHLFKPHDYFYIFPCMHGYHQSCFFQILKSHKNLRPEYKQIISDIQQLNEKLKQITIRKHRKQQRILLEQQQQNQSFFDKYFGNLDAQGQDRHGSVEINPLESFASGGNTGNNNNSSHLRTSSLMNTSNFKDARNSVIEDDYEDDEEEEMNIQIMEIKKIKERHDQIVAQECLKCGFIGVDMISEQFNKSNQSTWDL